MELRFFKMEGAGNDFIVIDNREAKLPLGTVIQLSPKLCNRRFGIGADGILLLEEAQLPEADYTMIYRNADGSDAGMCGNGSRCLAAFAVQQGFSLKQRFNVHSAIYTAVVDPENEQVTVDFPDVTLPSILNVKGKDLVQLYPGTEHVVWFVEEDQLDEESFLRTSGQSIRMDDLLNPPGTNVNFVCPVNDQKIRLQTYERGVENLTLACGTGAIASAIATHFKGFSSQTSYEVTVKGGRLEVSFTFDEKNASYTNVKLSGPAHFVFEGKIKI